MKIKFCKDCVHSRQRVEDYGALRCVHHVINANDYWALASTQEALGSSCTDERKQRGWFAKCGTKGKLWTAK
jgi:hypothetical protein